MPSEPVFLATCRQTFTRFMLAISSHLSRKRPVDTFLDFLTNSSSIAIVFFNEFLAALATIGSSSADPSKALYVYLEANPDSNLANVLDVEQQKRKLHAVAEDILQSFLESTAYRCEPVKVFLREVLAGLILERTVQSCSKPEFINGWIVYLLEERRTGILDAIDAGVGRATASTAGGSLAEPIITNGSARRSEGSETAGRRWENNSNHGRTVSRAENAMEEAMLEAKRLSELIAAEEANKTKELNRSTPEPGHPHPESHLSQGEAYGVLNHSRIELPDENSTEMLVEPLESPEKPSNFTTFDQILQSERPALLQRHSSEIRSLSIPPLTLHNANVSIFDDAQPGEKASMRSKPSVEYLLQVEPSSSQYPGWMIARKYTDFENLHEVLRRISVVSGVPRFAQNHSTIPTWKNRTKASLRGDLEQYLRDALSFNRLAESEGMKRFLEKDQAMVRASPAKQKSGFGFPSPAAFETMGKGMLDVLASAPKGAAGGGKAILGGVTGVLGGVGSIGQKRQGITSSPSPSRVDVQQSTGPAHSNGRESQDAGRDSFSLPSESRKVAGFSSRSSLSLPETSEESNPRLMESIPDSIGKTPSFTDLPKSDVFEPSDHYPQVEHNNTLNEMNAASELHLPPPPSEISDDYNVAQSSSRASTSADESTTVRSSISTTPTSSHSNMRNRSSSLLASSPNPPQREKPTPMTEKEAQVAVELFFAVINELYTLSSAWNIRRTLLNAAKAFLLRPGNPNLEAIRVLLQDTIIEANISDTGLSTHITKLRENALPTQEELKNWPSPATAEEKEKLRIKARKLLVEKGMPQALTSVMGAAASGEALGKVFDCLQVEEVARGLMFALILQGVRAVTQ